MDFSFEIAGNEARVTFSKNVYDKESVLSALYWLNKKYCIEVQDSESDYRVVMSQLEGLSFEEGDVIRDIQALNANVLDEQLRLMLETKAGKIRELIVRHAFSPIDLKKEVSS